MKTQVVFPASVAVLLAVLLLPVTPAHAIGTAASADDICAPVADPCIVDQIFDVTAALDFGARKLLIVPGGRLRGKPSVFLQAGAIEIAVGVSEDASIAGDGSDGGSVGLTALRSCSGDGTTRCLLDTQCASVSLGSCSAGNSGSILADGMITTTGNNAGSISIGAAGDITLKRRVNSNAIGAGAQPGSIHVESYQGSVFTTGQLTASSDLGTFDYESGYGGFIEVRSARDITLSNSIRAWGLASGGEVDIAAERDVLIHSDVIADAGSSVYAQGGSTSVSAGEDITLANLAGGDSTQEIGTDGGGVFKNGYYGYQGYWQSGYGGRQDWHAGQDLNLGPNSVLHSQGGPGGSAGYIYMYAPYGSATLDGTIRAQGLPPWRSGDGVAAGGLVSVYANEGITMGEDAAIDTSSPVGQGSVFLDAHGKLNLGGRIDVRGTARGEGYYALGISGKIGIGYSYQGDVTISGTLRGGGDDRVDYNWEINACRLHLTPTAVLSQKINFSNPEAGGIEISIGESMIADPGSRIETDPAAGTRTLISYRDPKKPPKLNGSISPSPLVFADGIGGCPVCGNAEIDQSESCDDGNTVSGDGCRSDCQDEGCISDTPGFPETALCDDSVACSQDECDSERHACRNVPSCDDGVDCTVDSCAADGCHHLVDDSICDDHNDCTFDLCNSATSCVYANLTGDACEDGDYCTAPGVCEQGSCSVTPAPRTTANAIRTKIFAGADNDRLKAQMKAEASDLNVNPVETGATIVVADALGRFIYQMELPPADWQQKQSGDLVTSHYSSRARAAGLGEVSTVAMTRDAAKNSVQIKIRLRGAELADTLGQEKLSVSMLFGELAGEDSCVTAHGIPCRARADSATCRD